MKFTRVPTAIIASLSLYAAIACRVAAFADFQRAEMGDFAAHKSDAISLVVNSGVEIGSGAAPDQWQMGSPVEGATLTWDSTTGYKSSRSLCISKTGSRYYPPAQWMQTISLKSACKQIWVSAYVRARDVRKAVLDVEFLGSDGKSLGHKWAAYIGAAKNGDPPANEDWTPYTDTVDVPEDAVQIVIAPQMWGPGTVWFDDIGVVPFSASSAVPAATTIRAAATLAVNAAPNSVPETNADTLEVFRRDAVVYDSPFGGGANGESAQPRLERLKFFPFHDAWPALPSMVRIPATDKFIDVSQSDLANYSAEGRGAWVFSQTLGSDIVPTAEQSLLFKQGITQSGGVIAANYVNLFVQGAMAGTVTLQSYGYVVVHGDMSGMIYCASYAGIVVQGTVTGTIDLASHGTTLYLLGGIGGSVQLPRGGRVYVAGRTTEADIRSHVTGSGYHMWLESSDMMPGAHAIGGATINVLGAGGLAESMTANAASPHDSRLLEPAPASPTAVSATAPDIACDEMRAGGDDNKRFLLMNAAATDARTPADGYRLLLILPGGDGSADFSPFVRRIAKNAVPPGYLVAQLVAHEWTPGQMKKIVWPTTKTTVAGARFSTEQFIESVVAEIAAKHKIDRRYVFALGWSSGGRPVYAETLSASSSVTGAFVAMSVFHETSLPDLAGARSKAFCLLHSQEDFIPIAQAERARDRLAANGARVTLEITTGSHGWSGDAYDQIRKGISWLEANAASGSKQ